MEVCRKLWNSWEPDAVVMDREAGVLADPAKVHRIEHVGRFFKSRGPLNVQLRLDGDRVVVFEVHARFSGTTPIRADAGFNEPDVMLRNFLDGERFGRLGYRSDLVALRAFEHVLVPFAQYQSLGGERQAGRHVTVIAAARAKCQFARRPI